MEASLSLSLFFCLLPPPLDPPPFFRLSHALTFIHLLYLQRPNVFVSVLVLRSRGHAPCTPPLYSLSLSLTHYPPPLTKKAVRRRVDDASECVSCALLPSLFSFLHACCPLQSARIPLEQVKTQPKVHFTLTHPHSLFH